MNPTSREVGAVDLDTISALRKALDSAIAGRLTGVIVVGFHREGYEVAMAGTPENSKTYALGALAMVERQVKRALGEALDRAQEPPAPPAAVPRRAG